MGKGQELYKKAKKLIPGGTQLLSKRPEQFLPDNWPAYYQKAKGVEVWDLDGKKYIDMSIMGIGACILGYADSDVDKAVNKAIKLGSMATLNCPEEVELAELMCELHPWADMVRYTRSGGECAAVAIRIARASSGKDKIAVCGYHGWHDWYLAANLGDTSKLDGQLMPGLQPKGVPRQLKGSVLTFNYNNREQFDKIILEHGTELGAIIMEPARGHDAPLEFLQYIRKTATELGIVLIFDEITSGFRMNCGGIHLLYGVNPDIAIFAKSISNGYPMGIILGKKSVMDAAQESFISSTYWTERIGPTAALATIRKYRKEKVDLYLIDMGKKIKKIWQNQADIAGLKLHISGIDTLGHFEFEYPNNLAIRTLFTQLMLEKDFLAWFQFKVSYAHQDKHYKLYERALAEVFPVLAKHQKEGNIENMLKGPIQSTGFKRLVD